LWNNGWVYLVFDGHPLVVFQSCMRRFKFLSIASLVLHKLVITTEL
jgi:hypothetical protein